MQGQEEDATLDRPGHTNEVAAPCQGSAEDSDDELVL
jgi:hypothetical protein